jgi:signal transduction histidine kinase
MSEPIITWNLFLTAFLVPLGLLLLGMWINRQFKTRDEKDLEIKNLLNKKDDEKEKAIIEWKSSVTQTLCDIKTKVEILGGALYDKVTWEHCSDRMDKLDERLREVERH